MHKCFLSEISLSSTDVLPSKNDKTFCIQIVRRKAFPLNVASSDCDSFGFE